MTDRIPEYAAVRHILTSPAIAGRTAAHIQADDFDWAGLLNEAESMSSGEQVLVRIAHDLWVAEPTVGLWEVPRKLDRGNFERVVGALRLCRGDVSAAGWKELLAAA